MKEKIKIISTIFLSIVVLLFPLFIEARSGCCSHHGGVCGCRCCDGTSLSVKCAPYYPQCSNSTTQSVKQPAQIIPQPLDTISSQTEQESAQTKQVEDSQEEDYPVTSNQLTAELPKEESGWPVWSWIIVLGALGYALYRFVRIKK
jgi:hypothetical protein